MNVYLVASALPSWMRTGYGHALLAADNDQILVSFAEYLGLTKVDRLTLAVEPMGHYAPGNGGDYRIEAPERDDPFYLDRLGNRTP